MLPSRGLRWSSQTVGIGRRRIEPCITRNFSSSRTLKASPFPPTRTTTSISANRAFPISRTAHFLRNGTGIRFASTAPASSIVQSATPGSVDAASTSAINGSEFAVSSAAFDNAVDFSTEHLLDMPEHIGYLNSLGLDHGWGPTSVMQFVLEHIHIYAGTPWWASIALTALALRIVLLKPFMNATENGARMATIAPITKPVQERAKEAMKNGDQQLTVELRNELARMNARAGIKVWKSFLPMGIQIFGAVGTFICLKAMAALPVPGLETGGMLWFYNLTVPDPLYILPLATAGILHWVIRNGGELGVQTMNPQVLKAMMWGMPALTLVFTSWLPAAMQLTFFVGGFLSFLQSRLFQQPWFRSYFNITPVPKQKGPKPSAGPPSAYKGTIRRIAPTGPLSTSELGNRFEGPKAGQSKFQPPTKATGMFAGVKDAVGSIKDAGKGVVEMATGKMEDNEAKRALKEKKAYELKRQAELKAEKEEAEQESRAERAARRAMKNGGR